MKEYRDDILKQHPRMKEIRAIEEPHYREIAAFLRPDDRDFDAHIQRRRDDSPIFDITPILAVEDFEGGFFSQATNPMNRWLEFSSGDQELDDYQPVKRWLWNRANNVLASFSPAVSPFYAEVPDWYGHICCFGWGGFYCEEIIGEGRISDRAIPINESFIERDASQRVNRYHREFNLTARQAENKWPGNSAVMKMRENDRAVFVHAVWPNPEFRPGRLGPSGMPFVSGYASPDVKDFYVPAGYYEFPYAVPSWRRRSGRPYPTGIGHTIRAEVVMLNEMERSNMVATQFLAEPTFLVHEKSDILARDVEPNALLYGGMSSDGKKLFDTVERHQNLPVSVQYAEQKRGVIKTACRWGLMQLLAQRPQMTATEFLGFQEEDLKLMGPGLTRVQNEGLSTIVGRRYNMLDRAGVFDYDPPPRELVGRKLAIKWVSPLAKMMQVAEAKGAIQFANALGQVKVANPDSNIMDNLDEDNFAVVVHDGFTSNPALLRDPRKRDQLRADRAAQQEAALKMQLAEQAANVHATVAHADQAKTLAEGRRQQQ